MNNDGNKILVVAVDGNGPSQIKTVQLDIDKLAWRADLPAVAYQRHHVDAFLHLPDMVYFKQLSLHT